MQFIDTHIHLQDYKQKFATDIIASSITLGIKKLICVSAIEADWAVIADLYTQFPEIIVPAFGLHPWYLDQAKVGWEQRLEVMLEKYPEALVGECGLDRGHNVNPEPQISAFKKHLELSAKLHRPLIIHAIKSQDWLENLWKSFPKKFVMHSYNGRSELMKKALSYGGYISFSSSILNNRDRVQLVNAIPPERLLVETDGPYQSPIKGSETQPSDLSQLVIGLSEIRKSDVSDLANQIYQNSLEFIKKW